MLCGKIKRETILFWTKKNREECGKETKEKYGFICLFNKGKNVFFTRLIRIKSLTSTRDKIIL